MDRYTRRFWITLAVLTGLRLWFVGRFALSPDEAYYWTWSRHLDWAYYDQGPLLAFIIRFGTWVAGQTETGVRLGAVVLSLVSSWFFFDLVRRAFHSTRAAWYGFLALQSALLFAVGAVLMMHDTVLMTCWMIALWGFYRAWCEDWSPGWLWGALALGLGALAKYSMVLFLPGLLCFLWLSPRQRRWWRSWHLYAAGALTAVLVLPLLVWNARHGWATFGHLSVLSGAQRTFSLSWRTGLEFLGSQLGVMTPLLGAFAWAAPVWAWSAWRRDPETSEAYLFFGCFSAPILAFFLLLSLHTSVYANWAAPAYPAALASLAGLLEAWRGGRQARTALAWSWAALLTGALLTVAVHAEAGWYPWPLPDRAAGSLDRVRGWRELGVETAHQLSAWSPNGAAPVLAARRYQIAAELSFYTPGLPEVQLLPEHPPAQNQYRFWDRSTLLRGRDLLFVCEDAWEAEHLRPYFAQIVALPVVAQRQGSRTFRELRYYRCSDFQPEGAVGMALAPAGTARP